MPPDVAHTGTAYDGLDRYEARTRILEDLAARGDLEGEKPHEMVIGRCQRSHDVVEPRLKTQWFVKTGPLAAAALEATRSGRTRILPERFEKVWEHWLTDDPRLERVAPAVVGPPDPGLVLPGRPRDGQCRHRRPAGLRGVRRSRRPS